MPTALDNGNARRASSFGPPPLGAVLFSRRQLRSPAMPRYVFCNRCDANLGVLFERAGEDGAWLDFRPYDICWHVTRERLVEELDALYRGESSLTVTLRRIEARAAQPA